MIYNFINLIGEVEADGSVSNFVRVTVHAKVNGGADWGGYEEVGLRINALAVNFGDA